MTRRNRAARCGRVWMACLLISWIGGVSIHAQTASGIIQGTITDAQGAVLPGVMLSIRSVETGIARTTISREQGQYRLPGLPPGHYDLTAELAGFNTAEVKDLTLAVGME